MLVEQEHSISLMLTQVKLLAMQFTLFNLSLVIPFFAFCAKLPTVDYLHACLIEEHFGTYKTQPHEGSTHAI